MSSATSNYLPVDYSQRVKMARELRGETQAKFAEIIGVSYATVNRWENGQSRPNNLSWQRIIELERSSREGGMEESEAIPNQGHPTTAYLDFSADPTVVSALAEAHRLAYGHLVNPAFASETSLIDPLPHQRLAVYEHMLQQSPLRFLLADDAGAGKTIMTGLYVREMLARRLIRRVLIVPPAGLVGNWEREMRTLFRLQFRVVSGADGRLGNPFSGAESDLVVLSVDTLAGERMFNHLGNPATEPYDLVVFDEAHKLSADRQTDSRVRKTERYQLAEATAGAGAESGRWALPWSAQHLLLLTATPHMGKDFPYYFLWRLLLPDTLSTYEAFTRFPNESRRRNFIRRTKEEMVRFDGSPIYPERRCDTLSYELSQGPGSEQELYDETTDYMRSHYNRARILNRSAARLAMSVFQRRLASSTYALMRSFERRTEKLEGLIERIRDGSLSEEELAGQQRQFDNLQDIFETQTADEQSAEAGEGEQQEEFEDRALGGAVGLNLAELEAERIKVKDLLDKARLLYADGEESKFEKLREALGDPDHAGEKFIIFTEHRDTAYFLVRRLEGLGFTGQVALIHGGMPYQERERQVEFFRRPLSEDGANFLVATDAAGEGINLQFCWLMVNYDIPWNPARLEQRMGRIHRYGQSHNPVVIINLVAGSTREGRVLKTLLDKLETIRRELNSDKVFDVIGRLFADVSMKDYLEQAALAENQADAVIDHLESSLTEDQVRAIQDRERLLYGTGGDVAGELDRLNDTIDQEVYRRLLPGYVLRFVEKTTPLLGLRIEGDLGTTFRLVPERPRALDPLLPALEKYGHEVRDRLTVYRPHNGEGSVWMYPGEPVFDQLSASLVGRFAAEGLKGTVFVDPYSTEPYLFHLALVTVEQVDNREAAWKQAPLPEPPGSAGPKARLRELRLVGLRQTGDGSVEELPVERLLLLKGANNFAPGGEPLAAMARGLVTEAQGFAQTAVVGSLVQRQRQEILETMPERLEFVSRGFDHQVAELAAARSRLNERVQAGNRPDAEELAEVKKRQRGLSAIRAARLDEIRAEPESIRPGEVEFLVHALVVPSQDPEELDRYDADVESIAVQVATSYEERFNATVKDVSRPELARRAGLSHWPGFDLLSQRPATPASPAQELAIEVKGRREYGSIEVEENEWTRACNLRDKYWLYVVFDCATANPRLVRIRDPFGKLLVKTRESTSYTITPGSLFEVAEPDGEAGA